MYQIVDSVDKGKIVFATKDFRPGEIIVEEEATLFIKKDDHLTSHYKRLETATRIPDTMWCLYDAFLLLSEEKKELLFDLFGPTTTPKCVQMRDLLAMSKLPFTDTQIETFLRVSSIAAHNAFGKEMGVESKIFTGASTRMSHSCQPNCASIIKNFRCKVAAKVAIKCGEELTINYNNDYDDKPIHERRTYLLRSKGFLCMCPRCTAPGDDNRQFNCSDAKCRGRMLACQPTSEDVPYLLPCSVCKRSASEAFTTEMLAMEKRMPEITKQLEEGFRRAKEANLFGDDHIRNALGPLIPERYPTWHRLSLNISDTVCSFHMDSRDKSLLFKAIDITLLPFSDILAIPNSSLSSAYQMIAMKLAMVDLYKAKEYMQKSLRMYMLCCGRDDRSVMRDQAMNMFLSMLPQNHKMTECAFCGETPEAVAITLSRCARCQKVAYCGRGCQLAHWEEHKKTCKKVASK